MKRGTICGLMLGGLIVFGVGGVVGAEEDEGENVSDNGSIVIPFKEAVAEKGHKSWDVPIKYPKINDKVDVVWKLDSTGSMG